MRKLVFVFCIVMLGCNSIPDDGLKYKPFFSHAYLDALLDADGISARQDDKGIFLALHSDFRIINSRNNEEFLAYAKRWGDDYFDDMLPDTRLGTMGYLMNDFTAIDLVCDRDFDQAHPAGSSLGDIVMFYGISAYPFIESGYDQSLVDSIRKQLGYEESAFARDGDVPVEKLLEDLTESDLKLLYWGMRLGFTIPPPAGKHNFTITFRSAEKVLTQTIEVNIQ